MDLSNQHLERGRYRSEAGKILIEVAVTHSRQLFNERDPAPFRERDLDQNFVTYVLSSVQEFALKVEMKLQILIQKEIEQSTSEAELQEAIHGYFRYESRLVQAKVRERLKISRLFFLIGLACLFACLGIAELLTSFGSNSQFVAIVSEGFVIVGWVAMWRPVEAILYDWWPLREQRLYLDKLAKIEIEVRHA